jgi:hypothetical protein
MSSKVVTAIKYCALLFVFMIAMISCEEEIENIGVSMIDNDSFNTGKFIAEIIANTQDIERIPANGSGQFLLGSYADPEFGLLNASIVTQLALPVTGSAYSYGTNAKIDSVIMTIPYQSSQEDNYADGIPQFSLDSIIGDPDIEFQLNIYELKTYLNKLDPNDPSKFAVYYSDKEFQHGTDLFYSDGFKVNPNDTVAYIKRYLADGVTVYSRDTIKETDLKPTIKIPLNEDLVQQLFMDNHTGPEFQTFDDFSRFFRGFYLEAHKLSGNAHLISLDMANSKMTIYYSEDEDEDVDEDLNDNGTTGETGVRTKHKFDFQFGSLKSNVFERDYSISKQSGNDRLYLQGTDGSLGVLELFVNDDINELRNKNWLITDASLYFYVDTNADSNILPEQLFIYNYDQNIQLIDMLIDGLNVVGGKLERDEEGNPIRYKIKITEYISDVLKSEDPADLVKLGVRVYNPSDSPSNISDIKVREYNWNPKGVVLFDNHISAGDKRLRLEINYTELQN